jgi:antitoxin VapB
MREKMALSIRNPKAEKLAREVAAESGENLTQAIIHSLEERLDRLRGRRTAPDTFQEIMTISKRCSSLPDEDQRSAEEILGYNQFGVPE